MFGINLSFKTKYFAVYVASSISTKVKPSYLPKNQILVATYSLLFIGY